MALCRICIHEKAKEINRMILGSNQPPKAIATLFKFAVWQVKDHRRKHLPWRNPKRPPAVTVDEQLTDLKLELRRLQVLAECGEHVAEALSVVRERRQMLELEMRAQGRLDATHRKLLLKDRPLEGNYKVEFVNGKPRTVAVKEGEQ